MEKEEVLEHADDQVGRIVCAILTQTALQSGRSAEEVMKIYLALRNEMSNTDDG